MKSFPPCLRVLQAIILLACSFVEAQEQTGPAEAGRASTAEAAVDAAPNSETDQSGSAETDSNSPDNTSESRSGGPTWDLEDLLNFAQENNPTLVQASALVDMASGIQTQVGLYPNPILYYNGANITKSLAGQQGGLLEQRIMTAGKLKLNRAIAAQTVNQATWLQQQQTLRVTNAVRMRYYQILGAQRRIELSQSLMTLAHKGADVTRKLQKSGEGTLTDVLQAEIEVGQAEILLNNSRNDYEAAWGQLTASLGVPQLEPISIRGSLDEAAPEFTWNETYSWLTANSPEVMVAQTMVTRAQIAMKRARVEPIPNVDVQAWVQRDTQVNQNIMQFQVAVPTPIFNRNQGAIFAAYSEYRRSIAAAEQVELSLKDRLAVAYRRYRSSLQQVSNYREKILPKAQQSLELIREGYQRGELTFLQVLVAQRTYFQTSLAYIDSLTQLWQSSVAISGMLLTEDSSTGTVPNADALQMP